MEAGKFSEEAFELEAELANQSRPSASAIPPDPNR